MSPPLKPSAVLCKDSHRFAVETSCGALVVTAPAGDPALEQTGLSRYADATQARPGVLRHTGVPVEVVRELIRLHGGFAEAGPDALAALKDAGRPSVPEAAPAVEEAADPRPFPEKPEPRWPKPGWVVTSCRLPHPYQH
ncbi:hypothetical protein E8E01_00360 [Methylorubrum populi]|uniref:hypothetical protein n=1 Tax=Methylorubrum populi TaxID=223967 RepID=UPI0011501A58|nr:hypothetical protein [Methylorubrum populi]QDI79008.1 hypothetical protein E8E01_00360 [Methylorubrum populi]